MASYMFGLQLGGTRDWVRQLWGDRKGEDVAEFVRDVLMQQLDYIQPLLRGEETILKAMRAQYFQSLRQVMTADELAETLQREVILALEGDSAE